MVENLRNEVRKLTNIVGSQDPISEYSFKELLSELVGRVFRKI